MTIGSGRDDGSLMAVFVCMLLCRVAEVWMVNERRTCVSSLWEVVVYYN